jgi:hypothetical protein
MSNFAKRILVIYPKKVSCLWIAVYVTGSNKSWDLLYRQTF